MTNNVIIDNVAFSIQKIGGISVVWYETISRLLKDSRYDVEFVECEDAVSNYYRKLLDMGKRKIFPISRRFFLLARYVNPKLGILHPYIFHSSYYRISRDKKAINFTTVHDFGYERSGSKSLRTRIHVWQQEQAVMKSDVVICISENTKKDLLHYYKDVNPEKVHVIYNAVSEEYSQLPSFEGIELPFERGKYMIYVGVRREYKNYDLVLEALAGTDYKLVIVGNPLTEGEIAVLDEKLGDGNYCCLSKIANKRLNELYNGAFALMYLSSYEGFGIPCIEAQKAGCPVIAYNGSSIPEVVDNKDLLVDELKVEAIRDKLKKLEDKSYRENTVESGLRFVKRFSWDESYRQLTTLYDRELEKARMNG